MKNNIPAELRNAAGIYEIRNLVNGKVYIGLTVNFYDRRANHASNLRRNRHANSYLQSSYVKYGANTHQFSILEAVSRRLGETKVDFIGRLEEFERFYIQKYRSNEQQYGYNVRQEVVIQRGSRTLVYDENEFNIAKLPKGGSTKIYNESQIKEAKILLHLNISSAAIARYLSLPSSSISAIKHNKQWKYIAVTDEEIKAYQLPGELTKKRLVVITPIKRKITYPYKNSKLNEQSIKDIAELLRQKVKVGAIAAKFNTSRGTITEIRKGLRWPNFSGINEGEIKTSTVRLTSNEVLLIKELLLVNTPFRIIADRFDVSTGAIVGIAKGQCWSKLTGITPSSQLRVTRRFKGKVLRSKLDESQVLYIKNLSKSGLSATEISKLITTVKRKSISNIIIGKAWTFITGFDKDAINQKTRRLSVNQLETIKSSLINGENPAALAKKHNVSSRHICQLRSDWEIAPMQPKRKLTQDEVKQIKIALNESIRICDLSKLFPHVTQSAISKINRGETWKHIVI